MKKRIELSSLPPKYQEQAIHQLSKTPVVAVSDKTGEASISWDGGKKRIRQEKGDGMNKTERRFFEYLKASATPYRQILREPIRLRLANGAWYKPDFAEIFTITPQVTEITFYETKGYMRESAAVRIKVAASLYPQFRFFIVTARGKGGRDGWHYEEVDA